VQQQELLFAELGGEGDGEDAGPRFVLVHHF
jgi:hypothetical protein